MRTIIAMLPKAARISLMCITCTAVLASLTAEANNGNLPRMTHSALLVRDGNGALFVSSPSQTWTLQTWSSWRIEPTMSRDGLTIASARVEDDVGGIATIGVYRGVKREWVELARVRKHFGKIAVAPDGSKIAFARLVHDDPHKSQMHIIEVDSGFEKIIPLGHRGGFDPNWSPSGDRIVYDAEPLTYPSTYPSTYEERKKVPPPEIRILELETGESFKIAEGHSPVWSLSGERILYLHTTVRILPWDGPNSWIEDPGPVRLMMVHPDGTGLKELKTFPKTRFLGILFPEEPGFWGSMLFSPDGKTILLNQVWNYSEGHRFDTYLLDLTTLKMKRKFRKAPLVFGWVEGS